MPDTSFMDDVIFPIHISWGSAGGPDWPADIVELGSGFEERNTKWSAPLRYYDARYGVRTHDELYEILALYHVAMGRLRGFRLLDWTDYRSGPPQTPVSPLDQTLGTGDGAIATFQLKKVYTAGAGSFTRDIKKPIAGTVRVSVDGVEKTLNDDFTVAVSTGIVTFTEASIPAMGEVVTAGFEFHVPVRFDGRMDQTAIKATIGDIPSIPLKELRL